MRIQNPEDLLVYAHECKEGLGRVLVQEGDVVSHELRKLIEHGKKYVTHNLELATIVHSLEMLRHYLLRRKFVVMVDHGGLQCLLVEGFKWLM